MLMTAAPGLLVPAGNDVVTTGVAKRTASQVETRSKIEQFLVNLTAALSLRPHWPICCKAGVVISAPEALTSLLTDLFACVRGANV